jgi:hypothetical protein
MLRAEKLLIVTVLLEMCSMQRVALVCDHLGEPTKVKRMRFMQQCKGRNFVTNKHTCSTLPCAYGLFVVEFEFFCMLGGGMGTCGQTMQKKLSLFLQEASVMTHFVPEC